MLMFKFVMMNDRLKKAIEKELMQQPSAKFTDKVMEEVFSLETVKSYKPLISKTVWVLLGILTVVFLAVLLSQPATTESTQPDFMNSMVKQIEAFEFKLPAFLNHVNLLTVSAVSLVIFLLISADSFLFRGEKTRNE